MKKIVLLPVKNESWILRQSLKNFSSFADHIIVADQGSTDGSRDIYKEFPKVTVIENTSVGHSNSVRWLLLDYMRKTYINDNEQKLVLCIDADEMLSKKTVEAMEEIAKNKDETLSFQLPWIQLWKDAQHYRKDGVWENNYKTIGFIDNESLDYNRELTINDHAPRIPATSEIIKLPEQPLLHFQYVAWEASQTKQAWYKASEKIEGKKSSQYINNKYKASGSSGAVIFETPHEWLKMIPEAIEVVDPGKPSEWHLEQILSWFKSYGILFFEELDIWHVGTLHAMFTEQNKRNPIPKFYPEILVKINNIKNNIKRCLKKFI